jgi:hypothetical protein
VLLGSKELLQGNQCEEVTMQTTAEVEVPQAIRLKTGVLDQQIAAHALRFRSELCRRAGIQRSTLERVVARGEQPGPRFIAGVLKALPDARFEDLFDIVPAAHP